MCRVAYIHDPRRIPLSELQTFFKDLEKSQGGQGNGLAWPNGGSVAIRKGLGVKVEELAQLAHSVGKPVLFHTRVASVGEVCDYLTQPFHAGDYVFAQNGSWEHWKSAVWTVLEEINPLQPISDALVLAALVKRFGPDFLASDLVDGAGTLWLLDKEGNFRGALRGGLQWFPRFFGSSVQKTREEQREEVPKKSRKLRKKRKRRKGKRGRSFRP